MCQFAYESISTTPLLIPATPDDVGHGTAMFLSVLFSILVYGVLAAYRREGEKFHSQPKTVNLRGAIIKVIPALHDNYMYLVSLNFDLYSNLI